MHTKDKGDIAEVAVILSAMKAGWSVSKPIGENQRYDLILDDGVALLKVQCKSGKLHNNIIVASLVRMARVSGVSGKFKREHYKQTEIDAFAIYCPDTNQSFLIKIKDLIIDNKIQGSIKLRVNESTANNQHTIRLANDYIL
jgi:hypothetical protein